jgi:hypothetical protein
VRRVAVAYQISDIVRLVHMATNGPASSECDDEACLVTRSKCGGSVMELKFSETPRLEVTKSSARFSWNLGNCTVCGKVVFCSIRKAI